MIIAFFHIAVLAALVIVCGWLVKAERDLKKEVEKLDTNVEILIAKVLPDRRSASENGQMDEISDDK